MSTPPGSTETIENSLPVPTEAELRQAAIKRLKKKKKRDFRGHLFIYIVVNVAFWTGWIIDGAVNTWVFPWPVFPTVFWGLFVIGHSNDLFWRHPLREELVEREIEDLRAASRVHPLDTYDLGDDDNC